MYFIFLLCFPIVLISNLDIRSDANGFISYNVGNMNLIITAPHGGSRRVSTIIKSLFIF